MENKKTYKKREILNGAKSSSYEMDNQSYKWMWLVGFRLAVCAPD